MINEEEIKGYLNQYEHEMPRFEKLVNEVIFAIESRIKAEMRNVVAVYGRTKTVTSFRDKIKRKGYTDPLNQNDDFAGVRIVCLYNDERREFAQIVEDLFKLVGKEDKEDALEVDQNGYIGTHLIIILGDKYSGPRYDNIKTLKCEVQIRTILQDAWAAVYHDLIYKKEPLVPKEEERRLLNVSGGLEALRDVMESVREEILKHRIEPPEKNLDTSSFLSQPIDNDTLIAYSMWISNLPISEAVQARILSDLDYSKYKTLKDIDDAVEKAKPAFNAFKAKAPRLHRYSSDIITKSLGFVDKEFRDRHGFGPTSLEAFEKYRHLIDK